MRINRIFSVLVLLPSISIGQVSQDQCKAEQTAVSEVGQKYKPTLDGYQKEGEDLKNSDAAAEFKFDVTWKDTEMNFGTPSVTIRDKKLIFGVPQVTMKPKDIIFHTPSVRMERVKTGQYPEIFCEDTWISLPFGGKTKGIPKCTTKWSNTYADLPISFMQEQRIKMDIPEFKWADTEIIMGVPEFFMQQQKIIMGLPQFKLNSVVINPKPLQDKSAELQNRVAETKAQMMTETSGEVHKLFACYRSGVTKGRAEVSLQFNSSLTQVDAIIQSIRAQGGDPTKLAGPDGTTANLVATRDDIIAKRDTALATFDKAISDLDANEKQSMEKLKA